MPDSRAKTQDPRPKTPEFGLWFWVWYSEGRGPLGTHGQPMLHIRTPPPPKDFSNVYTNISQQLRTVELFPIFDFRFQSAIENRQSAILLAVSSKLPLVNLLFNEFCCTPGSILTELNALVYPCIKRFCELVWFERRKYRAFFSRRFASPKRRISGGIGFILRYWCQSINRSCKAAKIDYQQKNEFDSPTSHDSPFLRHVLSANPPLAAFIFLY